MESKLKIIVLILISIVTFIVFYPYISYRTVIIDVNKTLIRTDQKFVYTNEEPFLVEDCKRFLVFDSSTLFGKIKDNTTYKAGVYGYRIPLPNKKWSFYRTIVSVEPIINSPVIQSAGEEIKSKELPPPVEQHISNTNEEL